MQKTKIDWATHTWNPIVGCTRGCSYCYARRFCLRIRRRIYWPLIRQGRAFPAKPLERIEDWDFSNPLFIPERLAEPRSPRKPAWVFVCSMGELFDTAVPDDWIFRIFKAMRQAPQHQYVLLTKCYLSAASLAGDAPAGTIWGVSVDHNGAAFNAAFGLKHVKELNPHLRRMVSAEPILEHLPELVNIILDGLLDWLILGAQTGPGAVKPKPEWVIELVEAADAAGIPTWCKDNLKGICPPSHWRRQKPEVP